MGTIPNDIRRLLDDCELFVLDILQDENLSESAEETRQVLLNNFRVVHARNPQEFPLRPESRDEEGSDDNRSSSLGRSAPSDDASDYQDDGVPEYFGDIPPVAAQDLSNILKQGYLEKKRKDHSFFGSEWQKRWCVLNNSIFYYFGSDKDKQQKGSFYINEYNVELVTTLRKDSKKTACFEFTAPGRRAFQFTASSPQEAREWVNQIKFVLTVTLISAWLLLYGRGPDTLCCSGQSPAMRQLLHLSQRSCLVYSKMGSGRATGLREVTDTLQFVLLPSSTVFTTKYSLIRSL